MRRGNLDAVAARSALKDSPALTRLPRFARNGKSYFAKAQAGDQAVLTFGEIPVVPAQAGTQELLPWESLPDFCPSLARWIPAKAGMMRNVNTAWNLTRTQFDDDGSKFTSINWIDRMMACGWGVQFFSIVKSAGAFTLINQILLILCIDVKDKMGTRECLELRIRDIAYPCGCEA